MTAAPPRPPELRVRGGGGGHVVGVPKEVIDTPRRIPVPASKKTSRRTIEKSRPVSPAEVDLEAIRHVAHRRMAVADVKGARGRDSAFGGTVGARQNEVESREVEGFDRPGKEREVPPIVPLGRGQLLEEGGPERMGLDAGAGRARHVKQCEDRRLGVELQKKLEHLFTAPQPGEPVVDDRNPHSFVRPRPEGRRGRGLSYTPRGSGPRPSPRRRSGLAPVRSRTIAASGRRYRRASSWRARFLPGCRDRRGEPRGPPPP